MTAPDVRPAHRVLCFVEPLTIRTGPQAFALAVRQFVRLTERLSLVPRVTAAILCNDALRQHARRVTWYTPERYGLENAHTPDWRERWVSRLHGKLPDDWRTFYAAVLDEFQPTIVYVWNTSPGFEAICRDRGIALLFVELGGVRTRGGARMSIDPKGFGHASALAATVAVDGTCEDAEAGWRWAAEHVLDEAQDLQSERPERRGQPPRVAVLLQYEDDVNWLLSPTYPDSLRYLEDVVPCLVDHGVGEVVIRMHPWHRSTAALGTIGRWPRTTIDLAHSSLLGELHAIDAVVTLNSTLGFECLLCGVPVIALSSCAYPAASAGPQRSAALPAFLDDVVGGRYWTAERTRAVGTYAHRLVAHYSAPQDIYLDATFHLDLLDAWTGSGSSPGWFAETPAPLALVVASHEEGGTRRRWWALGQELRATDDRLRHLHASTAENFGDRDTAFSEHLTRWRSGAALPEETRLSVARELPAAESTQTAALLYAELLQEASSEERQYHLASTFERLGELHVADALFGRVLEAVDRRSPLHGGALYHRGHIARALGQHQRARDYFRSCLEEVPGHRAALEELQACMRTHASDGWSVGQNSAWRERDDTDLWASLYGDAATGSKAYDVRFADGAQLIIEQTRERSFADVRGATELSRYRLFEPLLQAHWRVLDMASGTGYGADWLATRICRVVGVEPDESTVRFARHRYDGPCFVRAAAPHLPFATCAFDAVACVETLEHVDAHEAFVTELARVIVPGGYLLLTTPEAGSHDSPYHVRERTWPELVRLLAPWFGASDGWRRFERQAAGFGHELIARRVTAPWEHR